MPVGPSSSSDGGSDPASPRFSDLAAGTLSSFLEYLHIRLTLLGLEAKVARRSLVAGALLFFVGAFFLLLAWVGFCVALIAGLAGSTSLSWPLIAGIVAGVHALAGVAAFVIGRRCFSKSHFRDSLEELEHDREWLQRFRNRPPRS